MPLRAAIVGLGRVGMLFDDDPRRRRVWTHFSAYERLAERFELVAVCDPDEDRVSKAIARKPSVRAYAALEDLLDTTSVDVISLCTPIPLHAEQILACAGRVRAVVCEKPLAVDLRSAEQAVGACTATGTLLAVNYYKRFEPSVQRATQLVHSGALGDVRTATAFYAGPLDAVGSHAVDLLQLLLGPLEVTGALDGPAGTSATFRFGDDGGVAALMSTGPREDLVFEVDVIGSEGRVRILDNCARLELTRFSSSERYDGYRELFDAPIEETADGEPFLLLLNETADVLAGSAATLTSDGATALLTQNILETMAASVEP